MKCSGDSSVAVNNYTTLHYTTLHYTAPTSKPPFDREGCVGGQDPRGGISFSRIA